MEASERGTGGTGEQGGRNTVDEALTAAGGTVVGCGGDVTAGSPWSRDKCVSLVLVVSRLQGFMLFLSRIGKAKHLGCRLESSDASRRTRTAVLFPGDGGGGAHHSV